MPCNCKETRKVKSCPTISVEETILTELRNFYDYVVAKFTALFALPSLNTPTYEWVVVTDDNNPHGGEGEQFTYTAGETQYRFNYTLPAGVVFLAIHGSRHDIDVTSERVWFPGNVCAAPDSIVFEGASARLANMASVTAPAGGEIPPGLYSIASEVENFSPWMTYLKRV
jgi:hypothetical protein